MTVLDYLFWSLVLLGGLALSASYGASWWTLAKALSEADRRATRQPATGQPPADAAALGTASVQAARPGALV